MLNILIVDDDVCLSFILSEYLAGAGYSCTVAESAAQARVQLRRNTFDLVISDVNMPGESGFELLRYATSYHAGTAFLLMSAMDDVKNKQRALQMGACGYLVKPFSFGELHEKIGVIVKQYYRPFISISNRLSARVRKNGRQNFLNGSATTRMPSAESADRLNLLS